MRFLSVCSGIEAASVAWNPLGWKAVAFSEIEPFPCALLAHHYPSVPNLGDMTTIARRVLTEEVPAPDVFCGGTPCQAFSVAGLRESLADERGNLTLKFVEIADAIDHVRVGRGEDECIVFWENVPGVLSTKDNAFGCFLAGLAGENDPLEPPGGKWTNAGCVSGPQRTVAWRVLDAQYFGVAQRRRRVFVVASARKGFNPAQVLFEWDGVRRDTAPSRETGQSAAAGLEIGPGGGRFTDLNPTLDTRAKDGPIRNQLAGAVLQPVAPYVAHSLRGEGFDSSEDGTGRGTPLVPVGVTIHGTDPTVQKVASYDELAQCLRARTPGNIDNSSTTVVQQPVAFAQNSRNELRLEGGDGQRTGALSTGGGKPGQGVPCIAFPERMSATQCATTENLAPSMGALNPTAVAFNMHKSGNESSSLGISQDRTDCLRAFEKSPFAVQPAAGMQVRRLTPEECEALQGFPRGYTAIPNRGKPAADGPRYKALGNSWAVPNVRWIGERIEAVERIRIAQAATKTIAEAV